MSAWEEKAVAGDHASVVLEYVREHDHVSFAELQRRMEAFMPTRGELEMRLDSDGYGSLVLWTDLSEDLGEVLTRLRNEGKIVYVPCSLLVYIIDGGVLSIPVAKKPPKGGYKSPRWLPVVLRPRERVEPGQFVGGPREAA